FGDGMFKSTDEGLTWKNIGLNDVSGFAKIFVNRQNPDIIYALGAKGNVGFYRSTNGGTTWTRTISITGADMSVDPKNCNTILISSASSIMRSTDGGLTFKTVNTGLTLSSASRISVALSPADATHAFALVARSKGQGLYDYAEVYASTNGGVSWTMIKNMGGEFFHEQGFYDNFLLAHPTNPDGVLEGGIDVYRSDDRGMTALNLTNAYSSLGDPNTVHPDQHAVEFNPNDPNEILLGNDGGLYISKDGGDTWAHISLNLPITQFYKMDVDPNVATKVYGGSQDNGSSGSLNTGKASRKWKSISGGDGFYVAADPYNPGIVYSEIYYGTPIYRVNTDNLNDVQVIDGGIGGEKGDWSSPLAISLADGSIFSGRRNLWRSANGGGSWDRLATGVSGFISAIGLSPSEPDKMLVGSNNGEIRYSLNGGTTWARSTGFTTRHVTDIRFDPVVPNRVYMTLSGFGVPHVYRSEDNGATFTSISSNLPNAPVNCIAIDPITITHLFIGTDAGAFVSLDGGVTWLPFNEGLPLAPVVDMRIHLDGHVLIAATHGRSMYKIPIDVVQPQPTMITPIGNETFATPTTIPVKWLGLTPPTRVSISYNGGKTYTVAADNVTGTSVSISVPSIRTTTARVKVEEINGNRSLASGDFSLTAPTNGSEVNARTFVAEAIDVRKGYMWATVRGSDSLYKLKLPFLATRQGFVRINIPGHVRDIAYDSTFDRFYMLVTGDDLKTPKLFIMDTNGVGQGEIHLPDGLNSASGVAMYQGSIAIIAPGAQGEIVLIDTAGTLVTRTKGLQGVTEPDRRGLAWDGSGLLQGIVVKDSTSWFGSRLERVLFADRPTVGGVTPVVLPSINTLQFYGLAAEFASAGAGKLVVWATDTSGTFYKFIQNASGVDYSMPSAAGGRSSVVAIGEISPNPFRGETRVNFTLSSGRDISLDLYRPDGSLVVNLLSGSVEAGQHSVTVDGTLLASGIYYAVLRGNAGERDVRPVVVVK
ncbi:MAG: hypothetical protein ABIR47_03880, partial [Candidatus Kapaibacterium sp.]